MIERVVPLGFIASNNKAEYEALLSRLRTARELRIRQLIVHCDTQLVANQLTGEYAARDDRMVVYVREAQCFIYEIEDVKIKQISWEDNAHADSLASLATTVKSELRREILIDFLQSLSIGYQNVMCAE